MIILACRRHPLYKAKRRPRCDCPTCWTLWLLVNKPDANINLRVTQ